MDKMTVPISGMHCKSCEMLIEEQIIKIPEVQKVDVSHVSARAKIWYSGKAPSRDSLEAAVRQAGYKLGSGESLPWFSRNPNDWKRLFNGAAVLLLLFFAAKAAGVFSVSVNTSGGGLAIAALVGVVAGVSSCMALIGGLVLALSARHAETHPEASGLQKFRPHLFFNFGRIAGFALLGGLIGLIGGAFRPSAQLVGWLSMAVGIVMLFLGFKLIEVFPRLTNKSLTLPKALSRLAGAGRSREEYSHRSAFVAGVLTFFLPCGFTQAMQLYAISTGSFLQGALIMSLFALGTAPGLLSIGGLTSFFKGEKAKLFFSTAGVAVIALGIFNITSASHVVVPQKPAAQINGTQAAGPVQVVNMTQNDNGYYPRQFTVKKGRAVKWVINSTSNYSCASYIYMPKYRISKPLTLGENVIEFTPTETGDIAFSCSMGMYRGKFTVVE